MDEIVKQLRAALEPLAAWARVLEAETPDNHPLPNSVTHLSLTMAHARAAEAALKAAGFRDARQ